MEILITLVILVVVVWLALWLIDLLPINIGHGGVTLKTLLKIIVLLAAIIFLVRMLL